MKTFIETIYAWLQRVIKGSLTPQEVEGRLSNLALTSDEALDWRNSVVDLLKLLQQDSGPAERSNLAYAFGREAYRGSAEDNIWLHKEIMRRLTTGEMSIPYARQ